MHYNLIYILVATNRNSCLPYRG